MNKEQKIVYQQIRECKNPEHKLELLIRLCFRLLEIDSEKAKMFKEEAQQLSHTLKKPEYDLLLDICSALHLCKLNNYRQAIDLLIDALKKSSSMKLQIRSRIYNAIALVYMEIDDYNGSIAFLNHSLNIDIELGIHVDMCINLHLLGICYKNLRDQHSALYYLHQSLEIAQKKGELELEAKNLHEIGCVYKQLDQPDESLNFLNRSLHIFKSIEDQFGLSFVFKCMARIYETQHHQDHALNLYRKSIDVLEKTENIDRQCEAYYDIGEYLFKQLAHEDSLSYLEKIIDLSPQDQSSRLLCKVHKLAASIYETKKDFKQSLSHYRNFVKLWSDIYSADKDSRIESLSVKYEIEKAKRDSQIHQIKYNELSEAQKIAKMGSWELEQASNTIVGSDEFFKILGVHSDNNEMNLETFLSLLHPQDKGFLRNLIQEYLHSQNYFTTTVKLENINHEAKQIKIQACVESEVDYPEVRFIGTIQDITERKKQDEKREEMIRELKETLQNINELSGLVPICSECKKIRDDQGYWNRLEAYLAAHSEAKFTHGICPDCLKKLYPQLYSGKDSD